jgi:hypothetical protein
MKSHKINYFTLTPGSIIGRGAGIGDYASTQDSD